MPPRPAQVHGAIVRGAEIAARTRYDHIIDKGLERFNKMDVPDDATGLMVPREKKRRREGWDSAANRRAVLMGGGFGVDGLG